MLEDLLIITEGGQLLYSWHSEIKEEKDDDLISGFLSALNSFASIERGEDIKSLKLKETNIIFEKNDNYYTKLTFVVTTKNEELIELLHSAIHNIMDNFIKMYENVLEREFDGEITRFRKFDAYVEEIINSHGLDVLDTSIKKVEEGGALKSIIFLEPKGGNILYIHAKQYVNKKDISFLIPLIVNSAQLLYQTNLNEKVRWILLNTVRNENLLVEPRGKILIIRQYQLPENFEEDFLALDFFKSKDKYVKKPNKLVKVFENLEWNPKIKQIFLVDLMGKVIYSKRFDPSYDCSEYIPETISFLISSKKASEQIYSRVLFNSTIGGEKIATICVNFNNFALTMIGNIKDLSDFTVIQTLCLNIYRQLK